MPLYSCEGVVLRAERIEESDRLVHFFTDRFGRVRARVRGVTRMRSRYGSIAEPFSHDDLSLYLKREDRAVYSLTRAGLIDSHERLRGELPRYYAASFVVEMVDRCTQDGDPHYDLWLLLLETLDCLERTKHLASVLLAFQLKAFHSLGVGLDLGRCMVTGEAPPAEPVALSVSLGGVLGAGCHGQDASAEKLSPALYRLLCQAAELPMAKAAELDCPAPQWLEALRILRSFWATHLDFEPKSLNFIQSEIVEE